VGELKDTIEVMSAGDFTGQAYLNYSMYVIQQRALPHVSDGLKPVHRRILYAMDQLRLDHTAKYKKSARTVGDVLGKYHPHGDSACYETMVLMAQDFSSRYPLIDGQGNWGSQDDPKSFAAMRYTESRMQKYSKLLLEGIKLDTVDWQANFDGTLKEPETLPSQVPNILLNNSTGIAVGMATDIPSHNLGEVVDACITRLKSPNGKLDTILKCIKGPDLATGGVITSTPSELSAMYAKGHGGYMLRGGYEIEDGNIVITSIPYQTPLSRVIEQIHAVAEEKKMLADLIDDGDEEQQVRIVLVPRDKKANPEEIMEYLFAKTDLQSKMKFNMYMIGLDGKPQQKSLLQILDEWLIYRRETLTRQTKFELKQIEDRLHIAEGLLVAYLNVDEVIRIVREADEPKQALIEAFGLTEVQATAILEMRLRQLAKLQEIAIKKEIEELRAKQSELQSLLDSEDKMTALIVSQLREVKSQFADKRRTQFGEAANVDVEELDKPPAYPVTMVLSQKGWAKCIRGHEVDGSNTKFKDGDKFLLQLPTSSDSETVVISKLGRLFTIQNELLPNGNTAGDPIIKHAQFGADDGIAYVLPYEKEVKWLLSSNAGYGFTAVSDLMTTRGKKGKDLINLDGAGLLPPVDVTDLEYVAVLTKQGKLLVFKAEEVKTLTKGKGVKLIGLADGDSVSGICSIDEGETLLVHMRGRKPYRMKPSEWLDGYVLPRSRKGRYVPVRKAELIGLSVEE
jgi:topoisomerase-4 subunit A